LLTGRYLPFCFDFPDEPSVFFACPGGLFVGFDFVALDAEGWGVGATDGDGFDAAGLAVATVFAAAGVGVDAIAFGVDATVFGVAGGGAAVGATFAPAACGTGTWAGAGSCVVLDAAIACATAGAGLVTVATVGLVSPVTPATATTLTVIAAWLATPAAVNDGAEPSNGVPTSHDVGPIAHRSRGAETASSARTMSGSN
jgi:hypothetical protein